MKKFLIIVTVLLITISLVSQSYSQTAKGSRPAYVYDNADIISNEYESLLDNYLREVDDATSAEIIIWTTESFYGHGIKKDNQEIHDRDMLAHYIFNDVSLDGIKGIGKAGKDNGILILLSKERDASGGSMRIEIGRGLEGDVTDGTAGMILDSYLVPAKQLFQETNSTNVFDQAFLNTVIVLSEKIGYSNDDPDYVVSEPSQYQNESELEQILPLLPFIGIFIFLFIISRKRRRRGFYGGFIGGGFGGGGSGGGFGGGGGGSGGGGAGR
jgi:uncharacterized protein